jgi:hypothetical protein
VKLSAPNYAPNMPRSVNNLRKREITLPWINFQRIPARLDYTTAALLQEDQEAICACSASAEFNSERWPAKVLSRECIKLAGSRLHYWISGAKMTLVKRLKI